MESGERSPRDMRLRAIGWVRNELRDLHPPQGTDFSAVESVIELLTEFTPALEGVADYSHLIVIYWMHRVAPGDVTLKVHPRGLGQMPLVGLFATRAPVRPNPLGLSLCRLLAVEDNRITVRGLDALDGSPVIDIKPYIPEQPPEWTVPPWLRPFLR